MILAESSPSVEKVGGPMRERLAGFARTLRDNGFKVGLAETCDALAILTHSVASRPTSLGPRSDRCSARRIPIGSGSTRFSTPIGSASMCVGCARFRALRRKAGRRLAVARTR